MTHDIIINNFNIPFISIHSAFPKGGSMKRLIIILCCLFLIGCVSSTERRARFNDTWVGQSYQDVINKYGYPDSTSTLPGGNQLMVYHKSSSRIENSEVYVPNHLEGGKRVKGQYKTVQHTVTKRRSTFFEINEKGIVVNTSKKTDKL